MNKEKETPVTQVETENVAGQAQTILNRDRKENSDENKDQIDGKAGKDGTQETEAENR